MWRVSRFEFVVSMVAFAAVLLLGILKGVMRGGPGRRSLLLIRRAAHPHVAFLGRIPGTRGFSDMERNPDNEAVPGALVFRVEASLLYFNVEHVRDAVWQKIRSAAGPLKLVVCDLSISPIVDLAGARMLAKLHEELQGGGDTPAAGRGACGGARHPARRRTGGARRLLRPQDLGGRRHRRVPGRDGRPAGMA